MGNDQKQLALRHARRSLRNAGTHHGQARLGGMRMLANYELDLGFAFNEEHNLDTSRASCMCNFGVEDVLARGAVEPSARRCELA